jgi:hypothetical protein
MPPIAGLKIGTLNISWEANNYTEPAKRPTGVPSNAGRSFNRAREAWRAAGNRVERGKFGPAYEQSVAALKAADLDVILLQEFQVYDVRPGTSTLDVLTDRHHLDGFVVCAADIYSGGAVPAFASVVLVNRAVIAETPLDVSAAFPKRKASAFDEGRRIAIADVKLKKGAVSGSYRIVSSHSAHGITWDASRIERYLKRFKEIKPTLSSRTPSSLIWGGDFNSEVSIGSDMKWGANFLRKISRAAMGVTTEFERKIDWIIASSASGRNPTASAVEPVASDHRLVSLTTQARLTDWTDAASHQLE